jgi:ribosomal protein L30E
MSIKEISEAMIKGKVMFGLKQALRLAKDKKAKSAKVFVAKDAREDIMPALEKAGFKPEILKEKEEMSKQLGLDFESEVFILQ